MLIREVSVHKRPIRGTYRREIAKPTADSASANSAATPKSHAMILSTPDVSSDESARDTASFTQYVGTK